jgi:hypothetical protein
MGAHDPGGQTVKKSRVPDNDWQRIWFTARQRDWSSLALVPSDASVDVVRVADILMTTGQMHGERPVGVVNATGLQLPGVQKTIDSIAAITRREERAIVPVDPIDDNAAAIAILRACSAAVLVVRLKESLLSTALAATELIGRDHLLGGVVLEQ